MFSTKELVLKQFYGQMCGMVASESAYPPLLYLDGSVPFQEGPIAHIYITFESWIVIEQFSYRRLFIITHLHAK